MSRSSSIRNLFLLLRLYWLFKVLIGVQSLIKNLLDSLFLFRRILLMVVRKIYLFNDSAKGFTFIECVNCLFIYIKLTILIVSLIRVIFVTQIFNLFFQILNLFLLCLVINRNESVNVYIVVCPIFFYSLYLL